MKDDTGEFWSLGLSDFQSPRYFRERNEDWKHRRERTAKAGYDYAVTFGLLGWNGLEIGPPLEDDIVNDVISTRAMFGLRTVLQFGDYDTAYARRHLPDFESTRTWLKKLFRRIPKDCLHLVVICNEWQNRGDWGGNWRWGIEELRMLAADVREIVKPVPVITSQAVEGTSEAASIEDFQKMGKGSDLLDSHTDRGTGTWEDKVFSDISFSGQGWRAARQPRGPELFLPSGKRYRSGEPPGHKAAILPDIITPAIIGVHASAIFCSAVDTTFHSRHGTGNQGYMAIEDARGFWEVPQLKKLLPPDFPRYGFRNHTSGDRPYIIEAVGDQMGTMDGSKNGCVRCFARVRGNKHIAHPMAIPISCWFEARWDHHVTVKRLDLSVIHEQDLKKGQRFTLPQIDHAFVYGTT